MSQTDVIEIRKTFKETEFQGRLNDVFFEPPDHPFTNFTQFLASAAPVIANEIIEIYRKKPGLQMKVSLELSIEYVKYNHATGEVIDQKVHF